MAQTGSKRLQKFENGSKWLKMIKKTSKEFKKTQSGS